MSDFEGPRSDPHPALLLLPWYLNGTLSTADKREVENHLRDCQDCRTELDSLSELRGGIREYWDKAELVPAAARARVLDTIQQHKVVPLAKGHARDPGGSRTSWRDARSILPALAASIIVIQFGALLWISRPAPAPAVIIRGVAAGTTGVKIIFRPAATESDIRAAIRGLGARIVDGPDVDGAYTLQIPPGNEESNGKRLAALSRRKDLVEHLDLAGP